MKKQILTFMALALFTFTGTAFAENTMSSYKSNKGEMVQMHPLQDKKMAGNKDRQALMSKMFAIRQHVMQLLDNFKKDNGNKPLTQMQKDQIYAMMIQMMPKDKAQRAQMVQMNARMVQNMKSGDMSKHNEMMTKMDPEMKAKMIKMMPKTPEEKAKVKEACLLIHKMMQRMKKENNAGS